MRHGIFLFFKEEWWSEFFQFFKASLSSFCIFTDDKTDIIATEASNSVGEAQSIIEQVQEEFLEGLDVELGASRQEHLPCKFRDVFPILR